MQPFSSLGHINLKVADLDKSIDFYRRCGFPEFLRLTQADGTTWIVYLRITDALYIELLPNGKGRAGDQQAAGLNHLCFTTPDIEDTVRELKKNGIDLVAPLDPAKRGVDRNRGCWIVDPDGNRIEIMEMAPNCVQYEALETLARTGQPTSVVAPI